MMLVVGQQTHHHEPFHEYQHRHEKIETVRDGDEDDEASRDAEEVGEDFEIGFDEGLILLGL